MHSSNHHERCPPAEVQQSKLHLFVKSSHEGSSQGLFRKVAAATTRVACRLMGIASCQQHQQQGGRASAAHIKQQSYSHNLEQPQEQRMEVSLASNYPRQLYFIEHGAKAP
eukprot:1157179-Pelagomonas_calceolata.AAC.5